MRPATHTLQHEIENLDRLFTGELRLVNERIALEFLRQKLRLEKQKAQLLRRLAGRLTTPDR
ncbi:MAG: hypothetical protein HYR72_03720 [Deltaproteobacteria bacterium]|nr:hypothetical protein [Deltaproteobacteria bacterium]MBI3388703.1 hypothetical protein [Deltaproteobacteria bacterium]